MLEGALGLGQVEHPADDRGQSGWHLGDYELLDEVARGGMGIVYRARQVSLNRIVAVKLILIGRLADKGAIRRFQGEAASAAKLRHPNIVAIHEIGEEGGQHFFSMDYVEGQNLADVIRQQPISMRQAASFLKAIAEAIHYAHEQGLIHRDLKPSNILIDGAFEPRITDFGLARDLKADSDLTLTGQVLGSPNYISPEQASGKTAVSVASDVYSLGAILYHLLSGRPPFAAETLTDTLQQVATKEAVSPRLLNPSVPKDLETICLKCLEKEPAKRYATAAALAQDLGRFLDDAPIAARPVTRAERAWRWCRRKPVIAGLTAAVTLSIVLGFVGIVWQWRRAEQHAAESRRNLYAADMMLAQAALEAGNTGRAHELLQRYLPRRGEEDLRGWEWRYAWDQCRSTDLFTLEGHTLTVGALALATNGTILASGGFDGSIILWDLQTKKPIRTLPEPKGIYGLAFSKDEKELIVGTAAGEVSFWNCETWQKVTPLTNLTFIRSLTISPDGKLLAVFGLRILTLWNLADRREIKRFPLRGTSELIHGGIAFSPDSSVLAYSKGDGAIVLWNIPKATTIDELKGHQRYVSALAFSPDGSTLVSGSRDRTVRVWDPASGSELHRITNFASFVGGLAFSPDGGVLAVVGAAQGVKLFETRSWEEINTFNGHLDVVGVVVFAPNGKTILTASKDLTIKCWPVAANNEPRARRLPADVNSAALLPGAEGLYLSHTNQTVSFWRTDPVREIGRYSFQEARGFSAGMFSPDGKLWVAATTNGVVQIFDHAKERFIADLPLAVTTALGPKFAFSADGSMLAGRGKDYTCRVWRVVANADATPVVSEVAAFEMSKRRVWCLRLSPTGRLLAIGYDSGLAEIWNITTRQKLASLVGDKWSLSDIAITRDESTVVTASGSGKVRIWNLKSAREVGGSLSGQLASMQSVAFSQDESRLAGAGGDGTVRIWDMRSRQEVATLKLHNERIDRVAFRGDDSLVALAADGFGDARVFVLRAPK